MFTINIYLRFGLIALGFLGGALLTAFVGFWYAFPFFLMGLILLVGYILFGTIQSAAMLSQSGDMANAEKRLDLTYKPEWLYPANKAYYYMLKGMVSQQKGDTSQAEKWLEKAQSTNLPTDNEKAMVLLQLSSISANKGNWTKAQNYMRDIKKLNITLSEIKDQVKLLEQNLSQAGAMKNPNNMRQAMMGRSGFRQIKKK
jgi:tetratricopeptide (TPR) repeat protein